MEPTSANAAPLNRTPFMTYILLWINICVFLMLIFYDSFSFHTLFSGPRSEVLILFGAKQNGLIADFQLERLIIPMFLHANLIHLGVNMYAFWQVGRFLEIISGPYVMLAVYLVSGFLGNLWSFVLIPSWSSHSNFFSSENSYSALSVGASGSLFGILLFIFILQKYQERLAKETGYLEPKTDLGALLLVNAIITFLIPGIDWACHLGGAFAGTMLGLSFCLRHARYKKYFRAVRFFSFSDKIPTAKWFRHEAFPILIIIVVAFGCLSKIFFVPKNEILFGKALLLAAEERIEEHNLESLSLFHNIIENGKSSANPDKLFALALSLHRNKQFHAATMIYLVLIELYEYDIGSDLFLNPTNKLILNLALQAAQESRMLPLEIPINKSELDKADHANCFEPAELFRDLGFFAISGALFECAYFVNPKNDLYAIKTIEQFWRASHKKLLDQFISELENNTASLEPRSPPVTKNYSRETPQPEEEQDEEIPEIEEKSRI